VSITPIVQFSVKGTLWLPKLSFLPARRSKRGTCYSNVARWLAGWMSHAGIVSIPLTYLKTFSTICWPHHFNFFSPLRRYQIASGTPSAEALIHCCGKIGDFRRKSPFMSETVRDRPMTTMER